MLPWEASDAREGKRAANLEQGLRVAMGAPLGDLKRQVTGGKAASVASVDTSLMAHNSSMQRPSSFSLSLQKAVVLGKVEGRKRNRIAAEQTDSVGMGDPWPT